MLPAERMIIAVVAVASLLLQVLLAPHIAIGFAIPNFPLVVCLVVAILKPRYYSSILPFLLGLAYDFISGGPIGAMAFSLTAFSTAAAWFYERSNNDTVFMAIANLALGLFLVEVCYGVFLMCFNAGTDPIGAFAYRIFPCFVYDLVIAVIAYVVFVRFFQHDVTSQPMIDHLS